MPYATALHRRARGLIKASSLHALADGHPRRVNPYPTMVAQALSPHPPVFTHEQIMRVMWGVAFCIFLSALDQTIVVPAVPAMARDLKGFGQLSWIVSVYLLTSTAATPILGKLS